MVSVARSDEKYFIIVGEIDRNWAFIIECYFLWDVLEIGVVDQRKDVQHAALAHTDQVSSVVRELQIKNLLSTVKHSRVFFPVKPGQ